MSEQKIVSLRGEPIRPLGDVNPEIVRTLENLLERAKSGDLAAISVAMYHSDQSNSYDHCGPICYRQLGCVEAMKAWLANKINGS